eukprot:272780_1
MDGESTVKVGEAMDIERAAKRSKSEIVLGYWAIRGLAQPIRFILEYTGFPYKDHIYTQGDAPDFDRSVWLSEKKKNDWGLDFPNLPYMVDGDLRITQSNAILNYVAEKAKIGSTDVKVRARAACFLEQVVDWRSATCKMAYGTGDLEGHQSYVEAKILPSFEIALGDNEWLCGDKIEACDFAFYEMLFQHSVYYKGILKNFPKLEAYLTRFESLPQIKDYLESDRFGTWPFNNKVAKHGSTVNY